MSVISSDVLMPGVLLIELRRFEDHRGYFVETYHQRRYGHLGLKRPFVQDNHSNSKKRTLRGLHYQLRRPQEKLIYVVGGEVYDVAVDIRFGSPTFGKWAGVRLSRRNGRQIFIPGGFAHGFLVLSDQADVIYKCTDFYDPDDDYGIHWADPTIGIEWPAETPILSEKDEGLPLLQEIPEARLPRYPH
jgi:dTDP-4-dehydrorhamnose 3,5-epimerase